MATQHVLSSGHSIPSVGLGTWKSARGEVGEAVKTAVGIGYRHIDCASLYNNEKEVGAALADLIGAGTVRREELFVTSKLWNTHHRPADVRSACLASLRDLNLAYLDLYLVHWPVAFDPDKKGSKSHFIDVPFRDTWQAMEALVDEGLVKSIGVANQTVPKLKAILDYARIKPAVNQVEMHPYLQQQRLVDWCRAHDIHVTAYSCLGTSDFKSQSDPVLLADPVIGRIAAKHGKTAAQVLLRWGVERGTSVIPKSVNAGRIAQNMDVFGFALDDDDRTQIARLDRGFRFLNPASWHSWTHDKRHDIFADDADF